MYFVFSIKFKKKKKSQDNKVKREYYVLYGEKIVFITKYKDNKVKRDLKKDKNNNVLYFLSSFFYTY